MNKDIIQKVEKEFNSRGYFFNEDFLISTQDLIEIANKFNLWTYQIIAICGGLFDKYEKEGRRNDS